GRQPLRLSDEKGMYLEVMPNGSKYWRLKYRFNAKEKRLALGVYPETTLKEARLKRDDARRRLANGEDPGEQRKLEKMLKQAATANTFEAIALEWHARESHEWSAAHSERVLSAMQTHIFPYIGDRPIHDIRPLELLEV
ncbi:integrase, partial [Chromobacterium piscinae]